MQPNRTHLTYASYLGMTFMGVPPGLKASGQAMFGLAATGISRIIGSLFGGWLGERVGIRTMFLYGAVMVAVATTAFGIVRGSNMMAAMRKGRTGRS